LGFSPSLGVMVAGDVGSAISTSDDGEREEMMQGGTLAKSGAIARLQERPPARSR
jgi:hypothetical protein